MACMDSSDEDEKSVCRVQSTTAILETDISSQTCLSHRSASKLLDGEDKLDVDEIGSLQSRDRSSTMSSTRVLQDSSQRDRVMSDCTDVRKGRGMHNSPHKKSPGQVSFDGPRHEPAAKRLSKVHFNIAKSISLGMDGIAAKMSTIKRQPTGRKHKPRAMPDSNADLATVPSEEEVSFRKTCERKGTVRQKVPTLKENVGVVKSASASDVTFRSTVQRKGTARRVPAGKRTSRRASMDDDTVSINSCGELPTTFRSSQPAIPLCAKRSRLPFVNNLARMFSMDSTNAPTGRSLPKSQSNPVACLNNTPGTKRRLGLEANPSSSSLSANLKRKLKIAPS